MRRRFFKVVLLTLVVIGLFVVYLAWPGRSTYTVSPETTYVTEPLDASGNIDFAAALNERLRGSIMAQNNANVLIWKAMGPHPEGATMLPEYFQWMGIEAPPETGSYLIPYTKFLQTRVDGAAINGSFQQAEALQGYYDRQSRAMKSPWKAVSDPMLTEWLKQNEKPLTVLTEASKRTEYYNPLVPRRTADGDSGLIGVLLPNVQKCREFASALACRAMLRVGEGQLDDAWQDILACHRLGRLMGRGASLIEYLVGVAIETIASKAEIVLIDRAGFTSQKLKAMLATYQQLPPMPIPAEKIDKWERFMLLDSMVLVAKRGPRYLDTLAGGSGARKSGNGIKDRLFTYSINWDPALRNANRWYDRIGAALRIPDFAQRNQEMASLVQEIKQLRSEHEVLQMIEEKTIMGPTRRGERMGNLLIALMIPAFEKVQTAADRLEQNQRLQQLAYALACYKADHAKYPARLEDLVPAYLPTLPSDLFAGKPVQYRVVDQGYLLYSVGPNGVDDQGRSIEDNPPGDDLVIKMPVPIPPVK